MLGLVVSLMLRLVKSLHGLVESLLLVSLLLVESLLLVSLLLVSMLLVSLLIESLLLVSLLLVAGLLSVLRVCGSLRRSLRMIWFHLEEMNEWDDWCFYTSFLQK